MKEIKIFDSGDKVKRKIKETADRILKLYMELIQLQEDNAGIDYMLSEKLEAEEKLILRMKYFENKTVRTIADDIHVSASTASRKINYAIRKLVNII
ncbi:sigma-70 family RNA polymerase sigma factor [Clostridium sp. 19966]|uniref:sigma factor-like helix-turn-helix DNA-binding protein n=1 Tax=Clostridium sp. 19966 TaxID=2768166 RepID=UPI0028DF3940|nr:sigma factor-like helix-turn-helix DNA-binding protein [Clostridium sp. 19966]MDT8718208.1 sigma-70 family RNA polymerase sigma factor [Clostridium sp. 19966]